MSDSLSEFSSGNEGFLDLALQFGFAIEGDSDSGPDNQIILGEILVDISRLQEDIRHLTLQEHKNILHQKYLINFETYKPNLIFPLSRFGSLTDPSSLLKLTSSLNDLEHHLTYIADVSPALQHKLTNPVISDSLPLAAKESEK